jgi:outer membrane protein
MKRFTLYAVLAVVLLSALPAAAENLAGRFGVTGWVGLLVPSNNTVGNLAVETDVGFNYGGGFLYGIDRNWAVELDVTHSEYGSKTAQSKENMGDFSITNITLGAQYRFTIPEPNLVPYVGAGFDILLGDYDRGNVDTMVGVHLSGGVDYFLLKNLALNLEIKFLVSPEADINNATVNGLYTNAQGNFDPSSFSTMFGVRFFFN